MTYQDPKLVAWEARLKEVFDEVDRRLEETYGDRCTLHPARPRRGESGNPESDGLFNVGAVFTSGYGSESGRGYIVEVLMMTLDKVPDALREEILEDAVRQLQSLLPKCFPESRLQVVRDGRVFKIVGDLGF